MKAVVTISLVVNWFTAATLAHYHPTCGYTYYDPSKYTCEYGQLKPIDLTLDGPFTVTVFNPTAPFDGKTVEACGGRFLLGPDEPCTICPPFVQEEDECPPGEETIFLDDDDLFVAVPDGQKYYIEPNGALRYGPPPDDALLGVTAFENGTFSYEGAGWRACPIDGAGPEQRFEIFADLPGLFFIAICFPFEAIATPSTTGEPGAWAYAS